jgi:hypothetical protein
MRDALKRSMGEASLVEIRAQFERRVEQGELIEIGQQRPGTPGRAFTTGEMIGYERDIVERMRAGQNQHGHWPASPRGEKSSRNIGT